MKSLCAVMSVMVMLCLGIAAQADVFNLGAGFTSLETVAVGDPGNAVDDRWYNPGFGSVGYVYNIGKYEVTAAQYCDFLNHKAASDPYGLYNTAMWDKPYGCKIQRSGEDGSYTYSVASDWANRPVNYVSFWDSCRFTNWLSNGQGNGDTETGTYTINGYNGTNGIDITRNGGWTWAVASQDEWHKAAYYKGGGIDAGYWDYPTQSDTVPGRDITDVSGNNANYYIWQNNFTIGSPYYRTEVGEFQNSESAYGTFDQGGNVFEWNDVILYPGSGYAYRGFRGGGFETTSSCLMSWDSNTGTPNWEDSYVGFRVVAVPEPSSMVVLAGGMISLLGVRRRKV